MDIKHSMITFGNLPQEGMCFERAPRIPATSVQLTPEKAVRYGVVVGRREGECLLI